jgi:hypothetical protein
MRASANLKMEVEIEVTLVEFKPGYPAPASSDPDSPRFSDPGGDPEWGETLVFFVFRDKTGRVTKKIEVSEELYFYFRADIDLAIDAAIEKGEKLCDQEIEDQMIIRAEHMAEREQ